VVRCTHHPDSRSGTAGAEKYKVKGNIHWVSAKHAYAAKARLYDRLFKVAEPGKERDFVEDINPDSRKLVDAQVEPLLRDMRSRQVYQFERHGYFIADYDQLTFNRTVTLRDSWSKQ
jgi:glutaminyl-tRNA synthetase